MNSGELWGAVAVIVVAIVGSVSYWTRRVERVGNRLEALVESLEHFKAESAEDRRTIHRRIDKVENTTGILRERTASLAASLRKRTT